MKKNLLKKSRLYVILDKQACLPAAQAGKKRSLIETARAIARAGGADIIQYRDKDSDKYALYQNASCLRRLLAGSEVLFIINDHLDIAKITDADGLHLGQDDLPVGIARRILGRDKIIGKSCHSLSQALRAQDEGADYIGIGPVFATPTKPQAKPVGAEIIRRIKKKIRIPFFAIGGIDATNLKGIVASGADRIAVCRAVCAAINIPEGIKRIRGRL